MTEIEEKQVIDEKIRNNPDMTIAKIAESFGLSLSAFSKRRKDLGIRFTRPRGVKKGTGKKPLRIQE